ncbi:Hypothetical predicted protein [Paramuricea clavata]|uniref:Uncharacterized protein n=1 Tax=Paramuricea clavata TaxID=317549 RepID=A0A6S7IKT5_PARCT|nr:Hypothetical predicted protein [Paramuricea clavata]
MTWSNIMQYLLPSFFAKPMNHLWSGLINVTNDVCNTEQVMKEIKIDRDLLFKLCVKYEEVNIGQYLRNAVPYKHYFDNLFSFLLNAPLCKGFKIDVDKKTTNRDGTVVGITEKWSFSCADQ